MQEAQDKSTELIRQSGQNARTGTKEIAEKYLIFILDKEVYGLELLKVREIIGLMDITEVPRTPEEVKGVVNLRGKVIPIIDLRIKFGLEVAEATEETCVVVVDLGEVEIGVIIDEVSEVLDIPAKNIEEAPCFTGRVEDNFILGMGKTDDNVIILLNINQVLSMEGLGGFLI